jgi:hypothetical protein
VALSEEAAEEEAEEVEIEATEKSPCFCERFKNKKQKTKFYKDTKKYKYHLTCT